MYRSGAGLVAVVLRTLIVIGTVIVNVAGRTVRAVRVTVAGGVAGAGVGMVGRLRAILSVSVSRAVAVGAGNVGGPTGGVGDVWLGRVRVGGPDSEEGGERTEEPKKPRKEVRRHA